MGKAGKVIQAAIGHYTRLRLAVAACRFWYEQHLRALESDHQTRAAQAQSSYTRRIQELQARYEQAMLQAEQEFKGSVNRDVSGALQTAQNYLALIGASWDSPHWKQYHAPDGHIVPGAARLGILGLPDGGTYFQNGPAMLPLVRSRSVLFMSQPNQSQAALLLLKSLALRLAATFPSGAFRFILVDPIGQGGNLADFLRLPKLVRGDKIWSEAKDIENQLQELSRHIENVIQTRLYNTYSIIEEYNARVGEISVPYHFLIIANFPAAFSNTAIDCLLDVARNGPRTGTFFLATVDEGQKSPHGFDITSLANQSVDRGRPDR